MTKPLVAGAAQTDITPEGPQFLFGYPHVERISTGVHDRLLSSALFLSDGATPLLFVGNDVVAVGNDTVRRARERIERATGVPAANILIAATHTHSGPMTMDLLCCEADPVVPKADPGYFRRLEDGIAAAAVQAVHGARPAEVGVTIADGSCVGTNRHDPAGPSDPNVPVLAVRDRETSVYLAAMVVCSMHPTVLHEDSTLVSGDFPAMARQYLQEKALGKECPVIYFTGPSGNQSPRHITKSNTFAEAARIGGSLGSSVAKAIESLTFTSNIALECSRKLIELPPRDFPAIEEARARLEEAAARLEGRRRSGADARPVRTAECDWFGAEETLFLAQAAAAGRLKQAVASVMPAEVSLFRVGPWAFVGWPGEAFVEFALVVKSVCPNCFVISLANGELQGYLVTAEAVEQHWYEASNALFASPESGTRLVNATLELLGLDNPRGSVSGD
jgi:neutral ceramidase